MNWTSYARAYDLMADNNPAYREVVDEFEGYLPTWGVPDNATLVELGAGTGNFSMTAARLLPSVRVVHLERDGTMIAAAVAKAKRGRIGNIEFMEADMCVARFPRNSVHGFIAVNSLYACGCHVDVVRNMSDALVEGGYLFCCDLGRVVDLRDWSRYLYREMVRSRGILYAAGTFLRGWRVVVANRKIAAKQTSGEYWTHNLEDVTRLLTAVGFQVITSGIRYRGYSDLVLCKKQA